MLKAAPACKNEYSKRALCPDLLFPEFALTAGRSSRLFPIGMFTGWRFAFSFVWVLLTVHAADWRFDEGYRSRELRVSSSGRPYLQRLQPAATGITFTNYLSEERSQENSLRSSGSGVAAGDVDGDGWCDLFFAGMERPSALYRNLGNWKFQDITAEKGVACAGQNSTGAVFADVDGDGDLDLLVNSLGGGTRLFFNDGKGHFTEATDSGLLRKFGSTSMALADIDGNGTLDLYVANYATTKIEDRPNVRFDSKIVNGEVLLTAIDGVPMTSPELTNRYFVDAERIVREWGEPDVLYLNDGHGKFRAVSWTDGTFRDERDRPLALPPYDFGLSVMFRDLNGDQAPDIYVCNDLFPPDRIWVNDGHGRFRALSNLALRNTCRFSMGVDFADINRDGYDDFFVVDMLSRDHLHRKVQTVGVPSIHLPVGQIDNRPQYKRNTLFLNRGDGTYAEIAQLSGLEATEWSWAPVFLDLDLDGFEDVLVTTGYSRDSLNADAVEQILKLRRSHKLTDAQHRALKKQFFPALKTANQAFRNRGDLTFEDKAHEWGFDYVGISQGMCLADLDNDGDLDVVVVHLNDSVGIYRNETIAPRVAVRLKGKAPNTHGVGAKIRFRGGAVPEQSQEMICGGRYLSCDDTLRTFAVGPASNGMTVEVTWRNGAVSRIKEVRPNRLYEIDEGGAENVQGSKFEVQSSASAPSNPTSADAIPHSAFRSPHSPPFFMDVSHLLNHTHVDDAFDDFERQPLLARKLSQLGPGVSWCDVDGDGWDDLIIGSGAGGRLAVYHNNKQGGFDPWKSPVLTEPVKRDLTTILGWPKTNGQTVLLVGSSNYEDAAPRGSCVREFDLSKHRVEDNLPARESSTGPLAMADWNGDGILDLFVGGRVLPGRYPEEPFSLLFRGTGTKFELDRDATKQIVDAGLVSGAVFSDLNGDGWPELILACEWGPIRIFRNDRGNFVSWDYPVSFSELPVNSSLSTVRSINSQPSTLNQLTGWWNGVATGDFDGDGRMDIVASNWGRNTKYQSYREQPLRIIYGDWRNNGAVDALEVYYDPRINKWIPWCSFAVAKSMPWVLDQFTTHESFGAASIADILGERLSKAKTLRANWLETTVFLNRGDHFEARVLPLEAQLSPAFGISVGDLDGDGREDIFLSQNFFATDGDTPRCDAGRGLWLAGEGNGNFRAIPGQMSGIKVYGEQRGCALCDYDADGRLDLVVTQNGAQTKLYHNEGARPGLRVRLIGQPGNPSGIGANLRAVVAGKASPAREIHVGSGYWSQDSVVQIVATVEPPTEISVRWPGGKTMTVAAPSHAREIAIDRTGDVKVLR